MLIYFTVLYATLGLPIPTSRPIILGKNSVMLRAYSSVILYEITAYGKYIAYGKYTAYGKYIAALCLTKSLN